MSEPKEVGPREHRLSYRQMVIIAWAPVAAAIIEGVLRFIR
ncbi:hypothetical protein ABZ946_28840 [Streptomyces sp. NPDC046324]